MMVLYNVSKPMDWRKWSIWGISAAGLIFSVIFLKSLFGISAQLSWLAIGTLVGFAILAWPMLSGIQKVVNRFML